jgi:hypothetical protein
LTTWTGLTDETLTQDKPWTQSISRAVRDNPIAIAEGSSGSPSIVGLNPDVVQVASSSASLVFTDLPTNDLLEFEFFAVNPATTNSKLYVQVSTNNGSSWQSGYYYANHVASSAASDANEGGESAGQVVLSASAGVTNSGSVGLSGVLKIFSAGSTSTEKVGTWHLVHGDNAGHFVSVSGAGRLYGTSGTAINAVKFYFSSGNISVGKIALRARRSAVSN